MPLRAFKLPNDFTVLIELIPPAFQYPDNPEWNVQADEMESLVEAFTGFKKLWPLMRVVQLFSPPLRDILLGYIWEEDGKAVGLSNVMRQGATDRWYIGNVAVLPDYRGRGLARKLVQACVDLAKERGGKSVGLDVVAGNTPAYNLYEKLGFVCYSGQAELVYQSDAPLTDPVIPSGYRLEKTSPFNWRPRYELAQRITPDHVKQYAPVEEGRYRQPPMLRPLFPLIRTATGQFNQPFIVYETSSGTVVGGCMYGVRQRGGGINMMSISLDPAHAALGPYVVSHLLYEIQRLSPGRRITITIPHWAEALTQVALDAGFKKQLDQQAMALLL
jgi:GNAT superfamily N-acetyltransferase